jgi:hypothetical protein
MIVREGVCNAPAANNFNSVGHVGRDCDVSELLIITSQHHLVAKDHEDENLTSMFPLDVRIVKVHGTNGTHYSGLACASVGIDGHPSKLLSGHLGLQVSISTSNTLILVFTWPSKSMAQQLFFNGHPGLRLILIKLLLLFYGDVLLVLREAVAAYA